ncbi:MAG: LuxR family transcriptional regulator [Agromyces sp.]|nr:LuxR family transcriptional regulator [Agromyces sp.]
MPGPELDFGIETARRAYARGEWAVAASGFERAREQSALAPDDLARWGRSAWWLGRATESIARAEEAFAGFRDAGRTDEAAETALRISLLRLTGGDVTIGTAWMRRAQALLRDLPDGVLHAYLAYLEASAGLMSDDAVPWPAENVARLRDLAQRLPEPAVAALSLVVSGMADLRTGQTARGFAQLDEAMLGVLADDLDPEWGGDIFCTTIHACHELADYRRMSDWTQATEEWCRRFGSDAIYAGVCRVHRLELRSAAGDWDSVEEALSSVCGTLSRANPWVAGEGWYQLGELRRQRGDAAGAREAYALARESGIDPVPGEVLLALQAGEPDRAWSLITAALDGRDRLGRARLLRAAVEVALATERWDAAVALRDELRTIADEYDSPGFRAWADHADGMLALADGEVPAAVAALHSAVAYFRRHRLKCEQARVLAWLAAAYERGGDAGQAAHLRAEASAIFEGLGARADLEVVRRTVQEAGPLTPREREIVEQVARGASNREIADRLFISEKTVGRHLANVYLKLGVGSRTAAAAWWREQRPVGR